VSAVVENISEGFPTVEFEAQRVGLESEDGQPLCMIAKRPKGAKASVLCFHGLAQNRYSFDLPGRSLANYLVWRGFEVFLAEFRGHGLSGELGSRYPESFSENVFLDAPAFIHAVKRLSRSKPFVVGHSLGATIAYALAPELDDDISGIVGISGPSHLGFGLGPLRAVARLLAAVYPVSVFKLIPDAFPFYLDYLGKVFWALRGVLDSPVVPFPYRLWVPRSIEPDMLRERIELGFDRTGFSVVKQAVHWMAYGRFDDIDGDERFWQNARGRSVPLYFVVGDRDGGVPRESLMPVYEEAASQDKTLDVLGRDTCGVSFGHLDVICGRAAPRIVWPRIARWLSARAATAGRR